MPSLIEMTEHYTLKNIKWLKKIGEPLLTTFNVNFFWFQFQTCDGKFACIGNNPELILEYYNDKMHINTPFFVESDTIREGIYLATDVKNPIFQSNWNILENKYDTKHRISITKRNPNFISEYGLASSKKYSDSTSLLINHLTLINKFISYFEEEFSAVLQEMFRNPCELKNEIPKFVNRQNLADKFFTLTEGKKLKFLQQIGIIESSNDLKLNLSKREVEILAYYSKGLTAREVAAKLFLSQRTVENHLSNIKEKLLCSSRSELFFKFNQLKECQIE